MDRSSNKVGVVTRYLSNWDKVCSPTCLQHCKTDNLQKIFLETTSYNNTCIKCTLYKTLEMYILIPVQQNLFEWVGQMNFVLIQQAPVVYFQSDVSCFPS